MGNASPALIGEARIDPLLHPYGPADRQNIASRKLHHHPELTGVIDGTYLAGSVPVAGASSCEKAPASGSGSAVGVIPVSANANAANTAPQVSASSCESAPTSGAGSAAAVPDQVMDDAAAAKRAKAVANAAAKALAKEKEKQRQYDAAVCGTGGDIGNAMDKALALNKDSVDTPVDYSALYCRVTSKAVSDMQPEEHAAIRLWRLSAEYAYNGCSADSIRVCNACGLAFPWKRTEQRWVLTNEDEWWRNTA